MLDGYCAVVIGGVVGWNDIDSIDISTGPAWIMVCSERAIAAAAVGGVVVRRRRRRRRSGSRSIRYVLLDSSRWRFNGCPPHSTYIYERD